MIHLIRMVLPLPPSPNEYPGHYMQITRVKNSYRAECWNAAVSQQRPPRDPPAHVTISPAFFTSRTWDADNLASALKFPLDCLKQLQRGRMRWRSGLYTACGYFIDDDPGHMTLELPTQAIDTKVPRLDLIIEWEA